MKRVLIGIFLTLLVVVGVEFAYLRYLMKVRSQTGKNNLIAVIPSPTPTVAIVPVYIQYREWKPNIVASVINPSSNTLEYNVRALVKSINTEKKEIEALSGDNKIYFFQITPQTVFYTVSVFPSQPPIQKQEGSFEDLKEGEVVLFTWNLSKEESLDKPIVVSSLMRKK